MTAEDFRRLALELPDTNEGAHMDHPDFRVCGKIFATLWPAKARGVVMLNPAQQESAVKNEPGTFESVPGGWGLKGATIVHLERAKKKVVRAALTTAWRNKAPRSTGSPNRSGKKGSTISRT